MPNPILEAIILALALSVDCFGASLAYGADRIRISFANALLIDLSGCLILGLSLFLGILAGGQIPASVTQGASFLILFILALEKLLESSIHAWIRKCSPDTPAVEFRLFSFRFLLRVLCDSTNADADCSKTLSVKEALTLSLALSLDGIAAGISAGLCESFRIPVFLLFSFLFSLAALLLGSRIGNRAAKDGRHLSWISGIILLALAFARL